MVQALKLISCPFDGNVKELRSFCEGVEAAFELVHPDKHPILLKFVVSKILGDAKEKILSRSHRSWEEIKQILEENYAVRRTLEYYAGNLFVARQGPTETVAQWGARIDSIGTDLYSEVRNRMKRLEKQIGGNLLEGASALVGEFLKGTFVAGLKDERVKYIVKTKGEQVSMAQLVETALQEESECKSQRFKTQQTGQGQLWSQRDKEKYHQERKQYVKRESNMVQALQCYRCQGKGHMAKDCRNKQVCRNCRKTGHETRDCQLRGNQLGGTSIQGNRH